MHDIVVKFLISGFSDVAWWQIVVFTLVTTHITIASVTIFLHRSQAHRALTLHPVVSHFFRFWLWLNTGMVTKQWVAIHRKHHAKCETKGDPHSPQVYGIKKVLLEGSELYRAEAKNAGTLERYGHNTPDDWLERHVYAKRIFHGVGLLLVTDVLFFGIIGLTVWATQMLWIPVLAAGVINGLGHWWGYRNFDTKQPEKPDASTNISPWGIIIGGEELHNNHHTYPTSAKLSVRPWEFDIGWVYIRAMEIVGFAKVRQTHLPPQVGINWARFGLSIKTPEHIQSLRYELVAMLDQMRQAWYMSPETHEQLRRFRERFNAIWAGANLRRDQVLDLLQTWCNDAKKSGIPDLEQLAFQLPCWEARRR